MAPSKIYFWTGPIWVCSWVLYMKFYGQHRFEFVAFELFIKNVDIFSQILDTPLPDIGTFLLLAIGNFWPIFNPFFPLHCQHLLWTSPFMIFSYMWVFINNFEYQTVWRDSLHSEIAWLCGGIRSSRGRHARLVISHVVVPYHSAAHKTLHFVASRLKPDRWLFSKTQNYEQNLSFLTNGKKKAKNTRFHKKKRAKYGQEWPKKCQNGENTPKIPDYKNNMSTLGKLSFLVPKYFQVENIGIRKSQI